MSSTPDSLHTADSAGSLPQFLRRGLRNYRAGYISTGSFTFCLSFTVFFAVINVFESYLFYDSGHLVMALVGGGILTRIWMSRRAAANPQDAG